MREATSKFRSRSGGAASGTHARASGGVFSRRSTVRQRNGKCGGGFGGSGGSASTATKTSGLGLYDKRPEEVLEMVRREGTLKPRVRRDLGTA